jgi:DNA-binding LacI/PurR family transcriptional regulator
VATRSERAVDGLIASRCEGLVLIATETTERQLRDIAERVPVTVIGRRGDRAGVDAVRAADAMGARAAVDLLVDLGHRRIRHIDGGRHAGAAERRRGFRDAMRHHGLEPDIVRGDHTEASGVPAAQALLSAPSGVTAVLAGNDRCAVGVLDTLLRAGIDVPGQLSVVG